VPKSEVLGLLQNFCGRVAKKEDRYFLAIDSRNPNGQPLEETIYQGTAEPAPPFILGCEEYWGTDIEKVRSKAVNVHRVIHLPPSFHSTTFSHKRRSITNQGE
jgi:hypothetical protein